MLRACALDFLGSWDSHLPLVEFAYNNSYQSSIDMALSEPLYGRKCRSPIHWHEAGKSKYLGPKLVEQANEVIEKIQHHMKTSQN